MKHGALLALAVIVLAAAGGYWAGQRSASTASAPAAQQAGAAAEKQERRLLYYRNPMGLPDTSPVPRKDQMGMDYIPVYEGEAPAVQGVAGEVQIRPERVQKLGVRSEEVQPRVLPMAVRAAGRVEADERRLFVVTAKFEGYVERLHVAVTGQRVARGQPLFDVYSPELVSAQREYLIAAQGIDALAAAGVEAQSGMRQLAAASLSRLRNWDISDEQVQALVRSAEPRRTLAFRSPVGGVVTSRKTTPGMRFQAGEPLYEIADLSSVWVIADVFEQDAGGLNPGATARVRINAYPDKVFPGRVDYVYPTLRSETRTVPVRVELANAAGLLKPGMFAEVDIADSSRAAVLTVPLAAVIDSGKRQVALVELGEGRFQPREVKLGRRNDEHVEVLAGLRAGERVVTAANFLIDAESKLRAALDALTPAAVPPGTAAGAGTVGKAVVHRAEGKVEEVDAQAGNAIIHHAPVASLNWPAMTMEFRAANAALLAALKPGAAISFDFVERAAGEWVITAVHPPGQPAATGGATGAAASHAGH